MTNLMGMEATKPATAEASADLQENKCNYCTANGLGCLISMSHHHTRTDTGVTSRTLMPLVQVAAGVRDLSPRFQQ